MSGVTTATYLAAAAVAVSAYAAYDSGQQSKAMGEYQADQAAADAAAERSAAQVQAEKIRKMARIQAGEANASLAASGVEVGEGTALRINQEIYRDAEEDASMTILNARNSAAKTDQQGVAARLQGNADARAGTLNATSSLMSGAYDGYTGWKKSQGTK